MHHNLARITAHTHLNYFTTHMHLCVKRLCAHTGSDLGTRQARATPASGYMISTQPACECSSRGMYAGRGTSAAGLGSYL